MYTPNRSIAYEKTLRRIAVAPVQAGLLPQPAAAQVSQRECSINKRWPFLVENVLPKPRAKNPLRSI